MERENAEAWVIIAFRGIFFFFSKHLKILKELSIKPILILREFRIKNKMQGVGD